MGDEQQETNEDESAETAIPEEPIKQWVSQDQQAVDQVNIGDQVTPQIEDKNNGTAI
jgi:hypothetical protein